MLNIYSQAAKIIIATSVLVMIMLVIVVTHPGLEVVLAVAVVLGCLVEIGIFAFFLGIFK